MLVPIFNIILGVILGDRLRDVIVAVGDAFDQISGKIDKISFTECGSYPGTVPAGATIAIHCKDRVSGTFVAVWMVGASTGKTVLTLCEVEVYGSEYFSI